MKVKIIIAVYALMCLMFLSANAQQSDFRFQNMTFHSKNTSETATHLSLNIYENRKIELVRVLYKPGGLIDSLNSGSFKGEIKTRDFKKLIHLLRQCNFESITSRDSVCYDDVINTIIVTHNNRYFRFKSRCLPTCLNNISKYLARLGRTVVLPRYDRALDFEE